MTIINRPLVAALFIAGLSTIARAQPKQQPRQSWTTDRVAMSVGDIITVVVDERLLATAEKRTSANDERSRDLGAGLSQDVTVAPIGGSASVRAANNGSSSQTGQASRANRFAGEISARVVAISPNGLAQIKGTKVLKLDKSSEELTLSGWVRPEDVSSRNIIESARVAEAKVEYHSSGGLDKPKGHRLLRILGVFWP